MKFLLTIALSCSTLASFGQKEEFNKYSNGLIYSNTTMEQLSFIVDSLNLKFKVCDLNKAYYSKAQTLAHFVSLDSVDADNAKTDLENNISWDDFLKKYPMADVDTNLLTVKFKYEDYHDKDMVEYSSIRLGKNYDHEINVSDSLNVYNKKVRATWAYNYYAATNYSSAYLGAFYFVNEFSAQPLPEKYGRMVQYSDCMVDTTVTIFKEGAKRSSWRDDTSEKIAEFFDYVSKMTNEPKPDKKNYKRYLKRHREWESRHISVLDTLSKKEEFKNKMKAAVQDALEKGGSDDKFEWYVGKYYSKKTELELKRGRIVVGGCSQDSRPRMHAVDIAILSAETVNWEIFLRAHLDIMNDRFERMSDGSYAWAGRQTYIKELEELNIDVPKLLVGISLRIENPGENHYYGSISRLGRALAETRYADEIESQMLSMIKDTSLDDYNRVLMYYLFLNYNYYNKSEERRKQNVEKLKIAIKELPLYIKSRITFEE